MRIRKEDLLQFIAGHARANEIIAQERRQRLAHLSVEEARREYEDLCALWEAHASRFPGDEWEVLRLDFLLERRRRFDRIGGRKGIP